MKEPTKELTQERLKELFNYNPDTGIFKRIKHSSSYVVGCIDKCSGYLVIGIDYKNYRANRLVWLYMEGYFPENVVDHKDRDKLNNKWSNLRNTSYQCNIRNRGLFKNNKTGVTGVSIRKKSGKYSVNIRVDKKLIYLGVYMLFSNAVVVRWSAEVKYGFPNCNTTSSAYNYLIEHNLL